MSKNKASNELKNKEFLSTMELAKILKISRVAIFNKIKKGQIKAQKIGRNFIIHKKEVDRLQNLDSAEIDNKTKQIIKKAVNKTIEDYGTALRMLGKE